MTQTDAQTLAMFFGEVPGGSSVAEDVIDQWYLWRDVRDQEGA